MYHISKDMVPRKCNAKVGECPLGEHFETMGHAEQALKTKYGTLSISKYDLLKRELNERKKSDNNLDALRSELASEQEKLNGVSVVSPINEILAGVSTPDGGATFNLDGVSPVSGFCASPYPEYSKVFDSAKDVTPVEIASYYQSVRDSTDILDNEDVYIGLWNDPETGKVYLDVSQHFKTAEEARVACEENDQIAFFDLQLMESVDVDRDAKSGQMV